MGTLVEDLPNLGHGVLIALLRLAEKAPAASRGSSQTLPSLPGLSPTHPALVSIPSAAAYRGYSLGSRFLLHSPRWCLLNPALRSAARYKISVASQSCSTYNTKDKSHFAVPHPKARRGHGGCRLPEVLYDNWCGAPHRGFGAGLLH